MCVSLRTSTKQIQIISGRNKLSSYLTLSFSCQFVMLKKEWLQLQRRQRLRILGDLSLLRPNFVVRGLLLLLAQHREGLVLKSTPHCNLGLSRSTRNSWAIVLGASWRIEIVIVVSLAEFQQTRHPETRAESTSIAPSSLLISLAVVHDVASDESRSQKRSSRS